MNKTKTQSALPPETVSSPKTKDIASRALPRRRLDSTTITEIARLVARGLTESESCRQLEINPAKWFDWKSRCNREKKFGDKLEKLRAVRIDSLLDRIEKCADGIGRFNLSRLWDERGQKIPQPVTIYCPYVPPE